jgi:serine/threonine-protein kinase
MSSNPASIGRYQVLNQLGRGGMGAVYLARDPAIGRLVAIKLLQGNFDDAELRERFLREARSSGRLSHVNIVTIFDVGEHDGCPFIAMEYVEGESLASIIRRRAPLPLSQKLRWMEELSDGLNYAHRGGIVHRDIKPSNILLDAEGVLKILDFGIARDVVSGSGITHSGMLIGSLNYMAPEQMLGLPIDGRADQFAAGVVFYELLTYQQPFPGGLDTGVLHKVISTVPPPIETIDATIDSALIAIVNRCLEKKREDRYPDMAAVRRDLAAVAKRIASGRQGDVADSMIAQPTPKADPDAQSPSGAGRIAELRRAQVLAHLTDAQRLFREGSSTHALESIEKGLLLDPENVEALHLEEQVRAAVEQRQAAAAQKPPAPEAFEPTVVMRHPVASDPAPSRPPQPPPAVDATMVFRRTEPPPTPSGTLPGVQLLVTRSADARVLGRRVLIIKPEFTIGRSPECDLNLPDHLWSRRHAEIKYVDDGFLVRDLHSSNGVFVNGRRVTEGALSFGATLTIGGTELNFRLTRDTTLPDLTGCVVADRYTLKQLLRESAKASVYVADDARIFSEVVIKLLSPDLVPFAGYSQEFQRAAQVAAKMKHPYILRLTDFGPATLQLGGAAPVRTQYVCFPLMSGGTLADRLEAKKAFLATRVSQWLSTIADALDYAHRQEVLHGDLKPSAIVFDEDDHPFLTDFSIAVQSQAGKGGPISGTPAFMAPELWDDGAVTAAAERFALAAIIYYVVTGSRPFEGQENPSVRDRNFRRGPIPAHEEAVHNGRTDVPRATGQVLSKALAGSPGDRYESATAFAEAFKASIRHIKERSGGPEVFISYQRGVSAPLAMYFADRLKAQGVQSFVDAERLDGAGPFPAHIERAIEDTDVFVCLLAGTTLQSEWVRREIGLALRYGKPMIPVMQESFTAAAVPPDDPAVASLLAHQGIPVLDKLNLHLEHTANDLVRLVRSAVAQRDRG